MANEVSVNAGMFAGYADDRTFAGLAVGFPMQHTTGAQVRGGVIRGNGNALGYVATTGLAATLKAGAYLLPTTATLGPIMLVLPTDTTFTHDAADGSQPRTDLIIAEVNDVGTASTTVKFRILKGTAGVGAPAPSLPGSLGNGAAVAIHSVSIPAGNTTLSTITDLRTYTVAAGGVLRIDGAIATPSLASSLPPDAVVFDAIYRRFAVRDATTGLMDVDYARDRFATFDLSRSAVPADGVTGGITDSLTGVTGFSLQWSAVGGLDDGLTGLTTANSATELIIAVPGWYDLSGVAQFHAVTSGSVTTLVHLSTNSGSSWSRLLGIGERSQATIFAPITSYAYQLAVGDRLRIMVYRTAGSSGTISGRCSLRCGRMI